MTSEEKLRLALWEAIRDIAGRDIRDHDDYKAAFLWCVERAKSALEAENARLREMLGGSAERREG